MVALVWSVWMFERLDALVIMVSLPFTSRTSATNTNAAVVAAVAFALNVTLEAPTAVILVPNGNGPF